MDIEFYEIPGLNAYVCTSEEVETTWIGTNLQGHDASYEMFNSINTKFDNDDVDNVNLYTSEKMNTSLDSFNENINQYEAQHKGNRLRQGLWAGAFGFLSGGANPLLIGLGIIYAMDAYGSHEKIKAVSGFKENVGSVNTIQNEALVELGKLYSEQNFDAKFEELNAVYADMNWKERWFTGPNNEHQIQVDAINMEISEGYMTLSTKAAEMAVENISEELMMVSQVYDMTSKGRNMSNTIIPVVKK